MQNIVRSKLVSKDYNQNLLLPPSLEELIDPNHPVRVVNQVVLLLIDHGHITLKEACLDGTKIEANANRYTYVWGRTIKYNRGRIRNQLKERWSYAEQIAKEEMEHNEPESFEEIDAEKESQAIEQIDKALAGKEVDKKVKQKLNYARKR